MWKAFNLFNVVGGCFRELGFKLNLIIYLTERLKWQKASKQKKKIPDRRQISFIGRLLMTSDSSLDDRVKNHSLNVSICCIVFEDRFYLPHNLIDTKCDC